MRKPYENSDARRAKAKRHALIQAGTIPGLFEKDTKKIRPEVRRLIDAAIAKKEREP